MNRSLWAGFADDVLEKSAKKGEPALPASMKKVKKEIEGLLDYWGVEGAKVEFDPKASLLESHFDPETKQVFVGTGAAFDETPGAQTSPEVARIIGLHEAGHARAFGATPEPISKARMYAYGLGQLLSVPAGLLAAGLTRGRKHLPATHYAAARNAAITSGGFWAPTLLEEAAADVNAVIGAREIGEPVSYGALAAAQATYPIATGLNMLIAAGLSPAAQEVGEASREALREAQLGKKLKESLKRLIRRGK